LKQKKKRLAFISFHVKRLKINFMKAKMTINVLLLAGLFFIACSKDDTTKPSPPNPKAEETVVVLTIYDATAGLPTGRAAGAETDAPVGNEATINPAHGIKVVVFNDDGTLAYPLAGDSEKLNITETTSGSGVYKSDPFTINSGYKYFYIFANDHDDRITKPGTGILRHQFISQTTAAVLSTTDVLDITDPNFLMGTLWSEKKIAPVDGTLTAPGNVQLAIGRLSSKVNVTEINQGTSNMSGTFTNPRYRLGAIPKKIFLVGNNDEEGILPPGTGHGIVTSAVHNSSEAMDYQDYTATWKSPNTHFYTVENTTDPTLGIQFYSNTTYIQIRTVYTPDNDEVYNADLTEAGTFTGPTFYTGRLLSNGATLIFGEDPSTEAGNNPHPGIDQNSIRQYTDGINYHKFPIYDKQEGLPDVQRHAVLRNHSYIYKVTNILGLGSPDETVDTEEPIETPTTLTLEVEVAPWSKIMDDDVTI